MREVINFIGLKLLKKLNPEVAHGIALTLIKSGLISVKLPVVDPRLKTSLASLTLDNPIGLAAGFDKNGVAIDQLLAFGFGFVEIGAVTPQPQKGNQKPRVFRLKQDNAIINRLGFNNDGAEKISQRLTHRRSKGVVGLNIGANKGSFDQAKDYTEVIKRCGKYVDFATINISSPNTQNLRSLQNQKNLEILLSDLRKETKSFMDAKPVFLKIAPDLENFELEKIVESALKHQISGIIATNTTIDRKNLQSKNQYQTGGLSGKPLFKKSTSVLARLSVISEGKLPLIGVGGISTPEDIYLKICAGASAVQLYTALTLQHGPLLYDLSYGLLQLMEKDGYENISDAVGSKKDLLSKL